MRIGILSDTHDRIEITGRAVALLRGAGAEFLIHCGDVGGQQVLDQLAGIPCALIWGNNDWDRPALSRYCQSLGLDCYGNFADLELAGKRFAVSHGDDAAMTRRVLVEQKYDYFLHGHTHVAEDHRVGRTRVINPGALQRARTKSVAMLDTAADALEFHTVAD